MFLIYTVKLLQNAQKKTFNIMWFARFQSLKIVIFKNNNRLICNFWPRPTLDMVQHWPKVFFIGCILQIKKKTHGHFHDFCNI